MLQIGNVKNSDNNINTNNNRKNTFILRDIIQYWKQKEMAF